MSNGRCRPRDKGVGKNHLTRLNAVYAIACITLLNMKENSTGFCEKQSTIGTNMASYSVELVCRSLANRNGCAGTRISKLGNRRKLMKRRLLPNLVQNTNDIEWRLLTRVEFVEMQTKWSIPTNLIRHQSSKCRGAFSSPRQFSCRERCISL